MNNQEKQILKISHYSFFINGIAALIFGAIMPYILSDYSMNYDYGGFLLSILSTGNLIASVIAGELLIKIGFKRGAVIMSALIPIGFLIMALTKNPIYLVITFFLCGFGRGSNSNISNTIVNKISHGDVNKLNILHSFFAVGAFIAPLIAAWFLNKEIDWKILILSISIAAFIMPISYLFADLEKMIGIKSKDNNKKSKYDFLKKSEFYISSGILFFYIGVEYAVNGWIVTYLKDMGIMSTSMAQIVLSILWVIIIVGRLLTAKLGSKINTKNILFFNSIGVLVFYIFFLFQTNVYVIIFVILGLGFFLSGIYPTAVANTSKLFKNYDNYMGALLGIAGLGGIIMPYVTGFIADIYSMYSGMLVILFSAVCMLILTGVNKFKIKDTVD